MISYYDTPLAFAALRNGNVDAITQDDAKLVGLLGNLPESVKAEFELSPFSLTREYQALAAPKGETRLVEAVNKTLLKLESEGKSQQIYNQWFGPGTKAEQPRGEFKFAPLADQPK